VGLFAIPCLFFPSLVPAACPTEAAAVQTLSDLARSPKGKDVRWDAQSMVCGDFNGDGIPDQAVLGYRDHALLVAVRRGRWTGVAVYAKLTCHDTPNRSASQA
jgi:hypothetical protein